MDTKLDKKFLKIVQSECTEMVIYTPATRQKRYDLLLLIMLGVPKYFFERLYIYNSH